MIAKEKALDLITFFDKIQYDYSKGVAYTFYHLGINDRKKMAFKVIEEVISSIDWHDFEVPNEQIEYWEEVKKEIEQL